MPTLLCLSRIRRCLAALLTVTALMAPGAITLAQSPSLLHHRVRVSTALGSGEQARYVGLVVAQESDTLRVHTGNGTQAISWNAIRHLELSRGRRGHGRLGALIGAGVGVAFGLATVGSDDGQGSTGAGVVIIPLGAGLYGGLGALIGSLIRKERWKEVAVEQFRRP